MNKQLPEVGKMHIIGVVNVGGFMEYLVLQNTRLSLVMRMAEVISESLILGCRHFFAESELEERLIPRKAPLVASHPPLELEDSL